MRPFCVSNNLLSPKEMALPELVEATTSTIFAPGAMAWVYSTSKLVSKLQLSSAWWVSLGSNIGHPPSGQRMVKEGGGLMPKAESN